MTWPIAAVLISGIVSFAAVLIASMFSASKRDR